MYFWDSVFECLCLRRLRLSVCVCVCVCWCVGVIVSLCVWDCLIGPESPRAFVFEGTICTLWNMNITRAWVVARNSHSEGSQKETIPGKTNHLSRHFLQSQVFLGDCQHLLWVSLRESEKHTEVPGTESGRVLRKWLASLVITHRTETYHHGFCGLFHQA